MIIPHKNAIQTLIEQGTNPVRKVDWFNNQYSRYKDLKATRFPIAYIEFPGEITWKTTSNKQQNADVDILIHVVYFGVEDSPEAVLNLAHAVQLKLNEKALVTNNLQLSTKLMRVGSELVQRYDQLKIVKLRYRTTIFDNSLVDPTQTIAGPVNFVINQI